jgi:2-dehydropantoate 2-reductase
MIKKMKVAVIGLGAIGSAIGGFLKLKGFDVAGYGRNPHVSEIRRDGLKIRGIWGKHTVKNFEVYSSVDEGKERLKVSDFIIISTKSFDTRKAVEEISKYVKEDAVVASFQNGLGNMEEIADVVGERRTGGARVIFGSKILSPGEIEITVYGGEVLVGHFLRENAPEWAIEKIKKVVDFLNSSGIPSRFVEDVKIYLWEKMLYNCTLNPLSAIFNLPYGVLYENYETRSIMKDVLKEIFALMDKMGIETRWKGCEDYFRYFGEKLIPPTSAHIASMAEDIKNGKRTEIDFMNGYMVRMGEKVGVDMPVNRTLTLMIKFLERRR